MENNNKLYEIFQNALKDKELICFGIGAIFWQFVNKYNGKSISMLIDNQKYGEKLKIKDKDYTISKVDEIKNFDPDKVVILITVKYFDEMKKQLQNLGYFNVFSWVEVDNFSKPLFNNATKFLIKYSVEQVERNYKLKIAHIARHVGNAGDIVLNYCVRKVFNKVLDDNYFYMRNVDEKVTPNTIEIFNKFDAILIGGGGLFLPDTNKNEISGWQWACSKELMAKIKKPLIGFAIGYNYFSGQQPDKFFKDNLKYFVQKSCFLGLRNQRSLRIIGDIIGFADQIGGGYCMIA